MEMIDQNFQRMLTGHALILAQIIYHMPDAPLFLQVYFRQEYDRIPDLPELRKFCRFWNDNLDGKIQGVIVSSSALIRPTEINVARFIN